jgi:two-component system, NtrC family, sensor kinase
VSPEPARRPRWPLAFYLLAAFDVLTVSASLYLNHRIMRIYVDSVEANQDWAGRMADYAALGNLAAEVNAPGNDVFDSRDVSRESPRMERALVEFQSRIAALRRALGGELPADEAGPLLSRLDEIEIAMSEMVAEARLIFSHFEEGQRVQAGERMATMDRKYARLLRAQRELSAQVAAIQQDKFERQTDAAAALHRFEYVFAGLIVLMVTAATVYGRRTSRQSALVARERARHIAELQAAGESLRRAHADLETRVEERTRELQIMQENARREERMAAMGSLVAGVAHEVRNPLFGISSTLDAFEARHGAEEPFRKYLTVLRRETDRLGNLMRDLLDYGRPRGLELAETEVEDVVDEAVGLCEARARTSEVRVVKVGAFALGSVPLDRSRMVQVLQNLVENAIQHSPQGGVVEIGGGRSREGSKSWAWCSVRDEGPGFRAEDLRRVFEPFFTRRVGGTGMGLSIAQRIVSQHGGSLDAANDPRGGAVVTVRLPAAVGATASSA